MREGEPKSEEEKTPEMAVSKAVSAVESKDAADPVSNSAFVRGTKAFLSPSENWKDAKSVAKTGFFGTIIGLGAGYKILKGLYDFAKKAVDKKGNISFSEGFQMGHDLFSFEDKKNK